jgi:hypothetical protein
LSNKIEVGNYWATLYHTTSAAAWWLIEGNGVVPGTLCEGSEGFISGLLRIFDLTYKAGYETGREDFKHDLLSKL